MLSCYGIGSGVLFLLKGCVISRFTVMYKVNQNLKKAPDLKNV